MPKKIKDLPKPKGRSAEAPGQKDKNKNLDKKININKINNLEIRHGFINILVLRADSYIKFIDNICGSSQLHNYKALIDQIFSTFNSKPRTIGELFEVPVSLLIAKDQKNHVARFEVTRLNRKSTPQEFEFKFINGE